MCCGWVGATLDDVACPLCDPGVVNVLQWEEGRSTYELLRFNDTLESLLVQNITVLIPPCDGVCQDALHFASVKVAEEFGGSSKFPQLP